MVLLGKGIHICTGKGVNFWRAADYIRDRIVHIASLLDLAANRLADDSYRTILNPNNIRFFAVSTGNGGLTFEMMRGEMLVYKPIPLSAWEGMQRWGDLLRKSTKQKRKDEIALRLPRRINYSRDSDPFVVNGLQSVTKQIHVHKFKPEEGDFNPILKPEDIDREVEPDLTPDEKNHRNRLMADVRDHVMFDAGRATKANYVFDFDRIINDPALNKEWEQKTGIKVNGPDSFMQAFKFISKDWQISSYFSDAHGTLFVDVVAKGVNKGLSARLVKNAYQGYRRLWLANSQGIDPATVVLPKILTFGLADNPLPGSNDEEILYRSGASVTGHHTVRHSHRQKNPIYLGDIYDPDKHLTNVEITNLFLHDVIAISKPPDWVNKVFQILQQESKRLV